jgi:hypothetical protein
MRTYLILVLAAAALQAADIKGTVVENQTGHPVARAAVSIESVPGGSGLRQSGRTNLNGFFEFPTLPAGVYLVTAARTGFATVQYGQKTWESAGMPVTVAENDSAVLNIRLPRFGAIAGTVLDENDVGLPDHEVIAYRDTQPPRPGARARSDDRGMFRISGLEPGGYLVRTAGKQYEDISYLPTFAKESETVSQAFPVQVELDQQVDRADVRPVTGRLFMLTVEAETVPANPSEPLPVTMTLASELGRETVQGNVHRFGPLPAGDYEVFSQAPLDKRPGFQGDYRKVNLNQDTTIRFVLHEEPDVLFTFEGTSVQTGNSGSIKVLARRNDLAGPGAEQVLKLENNRAHLSAGPWQLALAPDPTFYVSGFSGQRIQQSGNGRADGWNDFAGGGVRFTLSGSPGAIHGTVKSGADPAVGAPVFLESEDLEPARRVTQAFMTRTDVHGQYHFSGLAPGNYRVLSSFEYLKVDSTTMAQPAAKSVVVENSHDVPQDLDLFVLP